MIRAPIISEALAGAHRAEWCLRVDRYHGANAVRWPADVVKAMVNAQSEWLGRMESDPAVGAVEVVAETDACLFIDGAWWCVVVWHWVDRRADAVGSVGWAKEPALGAGDVPTNDDALRPRGHALLRASAPQGLAHPTNCRDCGG